MSDDSIFPTLRAGDVLRLDEPIGEIPDGMWVVIEVGYMVTLSRLGEDEDGNMCTTSRVVKVTLTEIERFRPMKLTIDKPL